ncbi:hypothetical protein [Streptococcus ruminantium]|uniref:Uncharacterized protein n=1 Tax=Streptococcus ruminantium TaxID=1917441 RepID=A0ABU1B2I0_9STRE|nr:hypothetical protein [Streptococcus ruminantium]MDQ8759317.1 hypothetical protein [Streptococcus ruminantium]MDQ8768382.1 hypothetical protein [Streptococcus ruminantium]MDQ8774847.1 hypothetical protein [Streptococcus ruminantium]MDQ8793298.1 hypothetical protein [Streptococcus ruminantium]MDQ8795890.1 hypothetical protein [Streptococcus ruminantium]
MALKETGRVFVVKELIEEKSAGCGCVTIALLIGAGIYVFPVLLQSILPILVIVGIIWLFKKFRSK